MTHECAQPEWFDTARPVPWSLALCVEHVARGVHADPPGATDPTCGGDGLTIGGDEGLEQLGTADQRSHSFITGKTQSGALLEATEDMDVLLETLDLQRCMMIPLASANVGSRLQEWHADSNRQRYEHIANQIDSTLRENETGLLLISERHQVQFPSDIEVFYVSPPALDEYRRWFNNWMEQQSRQAGTPEGATENEEEEDTPDDGDESVDETEPN